MEALSLTEFRQSPPDPCPFGHLAHKSPSVIDFSHSLFSEVPERVEVNSTVLTVFRLRLSYGR